MNIHTFSRIATLTSAGVLLAGCATVQNPDPRDPWEGFNRNVYSFNDTVDRAVFRPVAEAYTFITPTPVRSCVSNVFSNLGDVWGAANFFLQGRGLDGINTMGRFLFNSTMGIGGCIDVASKTGAGKMPNDFGVTLGVWGFKQGPYLVLPIFGSSSVRDGVGLVGDVVANPVSLTHIENVRWRNSLIGLRLVDTRSQLLDASKTVDRVAIDPYSFVRDAYLQRRAAQVNGRDGAGNLPDYSIDDDDAVPAMPEVNTNAPAATNLNQPIKSR
ncbi:MAG: VacJ family lipoprotein [Burkholderiaceae bacterium]